MASPTDASHASLASGNQWEEEEKAFRERVDQEIKQVRAQPPPQQQQANPLEASHSTIAQTPVGKSPADEYTDSGRRRSVRFADQPDIQEGAEGSLGREDGSPEGMSADGDDDDLDDDLDDDVDADYDAADDAFEEDEDREDGLEDDEGNALSNAAATSELLANINISQLPSNILMQLTPQDVAEEFAERVGALELELSETKERAESSVREWKAKYRELDIQDILKHTEMATLRGENQELKEKVSSYKKNLWMKSVDLETIKLVEDEVLDVMTARDKELNNFRDIKQQEVEVIKQLHTKDMDDQTEILNKQLTDAMASIMQKECLTTNQKEGEELVHQSVNDPLDILKTLSSINVELHNKTFGSENPRAKLSAIIQQYRERELELLNGHIGPTPSQETGQRHAAEEEIIEKGRLDRCELNEYISELQDLMTASASGMPLLRELSKEAAEAADEARDTTLKSVAASEDGEDGFPTGIAADRLKELEARDAQLAQLVESMAEAHRAMAEVAAKAVEYDTLTNADEDRRLNAPSIEKLNRDPLFAGILYDSAFAQRLEDVLRENERLKARLHIAGDTKFAENPGAAQAELTQKADQLEARCNHLNAQCIALEEQKKELKTLKDQLQEEAEEYVRASPESALKKGVLQEITQRSDSEDTNSLPDSDTDSEDIYDEHQMMEMDQIAGVEVHVEEPEDEDPTTLALEKTQFHSTMRKEKHVASLVEQILQYLEVGCAVFRIRGLRLEKKYAYLAANRSVIRLCDYTEGKPNRKQGLDQVHLRHIKAIVLGQDTWDKKITKNLANKRIDPEDLHQVCLSAQSFDSRMHLLCTTVSEEQ